MAKDKQAREHSRLTACALANVLAAIVDAMGDAELPPMAIHRFLHRLDDLNQLQLWGEPLEFMETVICVLRRSVASND
ncbi:hypothetical protein [Sphingomonas hylomeconis]|uniref:Uncharacterized protein n=1 Tax=Sphingomonas hylomeconis TaxID=1395958 RepID=A0ABV7SQA9_9SPHN|nr:hypothetical protein [Sphingomonas hylomeconis]